MLVVARHGRTAWNAEGRFQGWADVPLDRMGREQAEALAEKLASQLPICASAPVHCGRSGICRPDGTPREDLVEALLGSGTDLDRILFEAPTKELQTRFIELVGTNVNLGNVAPSDVVGLETLRLGLRSDTLTLFERERSRV